MLAMCMLIVELRCSKTCFCAIIAVREDGGAGEVKCILTCPFAFDGSAIVID